MEICTAVEDDPAGYPHEYVLWTKAWLVNRVGRVRLNAQLSKPRVFREGVPQGGVLSPLLFLIFINDFPDTIPRQVDTSMFADDVALWKTHRDHRKAESLVQEAVEAAHQWSVQWKLDLSITKCEVSCFAQSSKIAGW